MSDSREKTIQDLSAELTPLKRPGIFIHRVALWLMLAFIFSVFVLRIDAPFREGWFTQLQHSPQFLLEMLSGLLAIVLASVLVFQLAIPGYPRRGLWIVLTLLAFLLWISFYLYGFYVSPALPNSMAGKRDTCYLDVLLWSLPGILFGCLFARRFSICNSWLSSALIGLVSGAILAWLMQLACMYSPWHTLTHHVLPILLIIPAGVLLGWRLLRS